MKPDAPPIAAEGPPQPRSKPPPEDTARRLVTFPRTGSDGSEHELRVSWAEFNGHPYVGLRVWSRNEAGGWWPTKAGLSVRLRELPDFAEAIGEARRLAEEQGAATGGPPGTWNP